jgi:hypothetical protein
MEFKINGVKIQSCSIRRHIKNHKRFPFEFNVYIVGRPKAQSFGKSYKNAIVNAFALAGCGNYRTEPSLLARMVSDAVGNGNMTWKPIIAILRGEFSGGL